MNSVDYPRRHLRFGWWSLFVFAAAGLGLELLHGFKIRLYLDVPNDTRRLMWTLAHAHGVGLALVHIAFAWTVQTRTGASVERWSPRLASDCLVASSLLLPGGFFLGGVSFYSGDPGLGALLIPVGAVLLLTGIVSTARASSAASR